MEWVQVFTCPTLLHLFHWIAPLDRIKQDRRSFQDFPLLAGTVWRGSSCECHESQVTNTTLSVPSLTAAPEAAQNAISPSFHFLHFPFNLSAATKDPATDTQQKRAFYQVAGLSAFWMCYFWKLKFANKPDLLSWNWFTIPYRQHFKKLFWANYILSWFPSD